MVLNLSNDDKRNHLDTILARADGFHDQQSGGIVPPVQMSTTFLRDVDYKPLNPDNVYGRDHNDQVRLAEQIICKIENGEESLLFGSGMSAISGILAGLRRGHTVLLQKGCYWGATDLIRRHCAQYEINLIEADSSDTAGFNNIISQNTPELVFVETPSNPWLKIADVKSIAEVTRRAGSFLVVDATAATPFLIKPLELGADVAMHSATKALNGHSDVIAGVLTCSDPASDVWRSAKAFRHGVGTILSPQSAWLLIRGMRTLPLRIERMCQSALEIAQFLSTHSAVSEVWYPGLESHSAFRLASDQMSNGYGYLLSFLVNGGKDEALEFCRNLVGIQRATSLGGVESLVEHRHTIEGDLTGCPENLIRLSVGIENKADLINELDQALSKI